MHLRKTIAGVCAKVVNPKKALPYQGRFHQNHGLFQLHPASSTFAFRCQLVCRFGVHAQGGEGLDRSGEDKAT